MASQEMALAWQLEFNLWNPQKVGRQEVTTQSSSDLHTCTHQPAHIVHTQVIKNVSFNVTEIQNK